jgi:CheY-like chemotaxis protein
MFGKDRVESRMNHRILVVEDDLVSQIVIAWILEEAGYCATVVSGGQTAIDTLMSIDYALVLMNCSVPGMAGFEATNAIRTGEAGTINPDIPIIALTTLGPVWSHTSASRLIRIN